MSNLYNVALGYLLTLRGLVALLRSNLGAGQTNGTRSAAFLGPQIRQYVYDAKDSSKVLLESGEPLGVTDLTLMLDLCVNISSDLEFIDRYTGLSSYANYIAEIRYIGSQTADRLRVQSF